MLRDGALLAVGTFTRLRVPPPARVDRQVAGTAMLLAPLVAAALALLAAGVLLLGRAAEGGGVQPLLPAALALAVLAWCTGGLHLDGLADVADGLASRRPAEQALAIMSRPETGALGVATLAFVLLLQVLGLGGATATGFGTDALVLGLVTSRVVMALACVRGVPAARVSGLGATVAGSVPRWSAAVLVLVVLVLGVVLGARDADGGVVQAVLAVAAGLAAGGWLVRRCVRRLGGITGDVLGAAGEVALTAVLVVCAASPDLAGPDWTWLPSRS